MEARDEKPVVTFVPSFSTLVIRYWQVGKGLLRGRAKLWYMYESFRVDENKARCFTIHDLCAIKFTGDNRLE